MKKTLYFAVLLLMTFMSMKAQCTYTGSPLTSVGTSTFCVNTPGTTNTISSAAVRAGQFVLLNVVQGFSYRFSVGNVFPADTESLTLLNAADNSSFGAGSFASGASGATINSWTAPLSGEIKVLLSRNCVNDNTAGGVITLTLLSVGNTLDNQSAFGVNTWVGHVYNYGGGVRPGGFPSPNPISSTTSPFLNANYVGNYTVATEGFTTNFGGNTACFDVFSNGVYRADIYTESFAVRYRMRSTRPAGCYTLNVSGDDGIRVYVDGVLVFDRWVDQGTTSYCDNLIRLTGNSDIVLDYYENAGGNNLTFSLAAFDGSGNAITSASNVRLCSGLTTNITGSVLGSCTGGTNGGTNSLYQWQISTNNVLFTDIVGATAANYLAPAVTVVAGAPNNVRYFRRVFKPSALIPGACEFNSSVVTVTTSGGAAAVPGPISGGTSQCRASVATYSIVAVPNAATYSWTNTGTGWTITPAADGLSVSVAFNATATNGILRVASVNGCGTSGNSSFNITVNPLPATPTLGTVTQPTCTVPTGSIALSGLPSAGTWTITASPTTSGITGLTGSGSTTTIGGLAQGTNYTFSVSNGTCSSIATATVPINNLVTTTFDGANWSSAPTLAKIGIVTASTASPISLSANTELCSCTVSANTNLIVNSGITLKLQNQLEVNSTGSITFQNNSSLVQINDAAINSGTISYKRQTTVVRIGSDYTYWSSPVSMQNLLNLSPNTNTGKFWSFNPAATWFVETPSIKTMDIGKGFIIRAPDSYYAAYPFFSSIFEATFTGEPNNGVKTIAVGASGTYNLLGNPYPSAIDAVKFLNANSTVLGGTIYFWTHNTEIRNKVGATNEGTGDLVYIQDDYASFNRTGGVGTAASSDPNKSPTNPNIPNGMIAAGQSFFTTSIAPAGTLVTFNNDMRLGASYLNNSQFFRTKASEKVTIEPEKNRIWLNLGNKKRAFKQMLVGYIEGATNDFDKAFDGVSFNANAIINFYSINNATNYAIQGRALPFVPSDLVPLGYSSSVEGEFTISIDTVDGLFTKQSVFLEDKSTNTMHNLKIAPYSFQTTKGTFNDRFVLRYTDKNQVIQDVITNSNDVVVTTKNKQLKVISGLGDIKSVAIYTVLGKQIYFQEAIAKKELIIDTLPASDQVLIVKTILVNDTLHTTKTIFK